MVLTQRKLAMTRVIEEPEGIFVCRQLGRVCEISCVLHYGLCVCLNTYMQPFLYIFRYESKPVSILSSSKEFLLYPSASTFSSIIYNSVQQQCVFVHVCTVMHTVGDTLLCVWN